MDKVKRYSHDGGDAAANWHRQACAELDERHGAGYATANPALVAALVQASAAHFHAAWLAEALEAHGAGLSDLASK